VVKIEDGADGVGRIVVQQPAAQPVSTSRDRSFGIGEDEFYEILEQRIPGASALLKSFIARADGLGIYADRQGGLNLKHAAPSGNALNLGTIDKRGYLDTSPATWWGRTAIGRRYNESLASQIGGSVRDMRTGKESAVRTATGTTPRILDLLPKHEEAWLAAIDQYIQDSLEAAKGQPLV
jgi:hypothetical protein